MKAFVTGGSGFVGGNLIQVLVRSGHKVRAVARSKKAQDAVFHIGAEPVEGDLGEVKALCAGMSRCETVFHCAAAMKFWNEERLHEQMYVEGTRNVLHACEKEGVSCLVFISAAAVQGMTPGRLSVPRSVAWASAVFLEALWRWLDLRGRPPITRSLLSLIGMPIELSDAKARTELGYAGRVSRSSGLEELRHVFREH
jgi:nucleoside-diphosphate-sugar epimerase